MKTISLIIGMAAMFTVGNVRAQDAFVADDGATYHEAIASLREAIKDNPNDVEARLELARTLSWVRSLGQVCQYDAYKFDILEQLDAVIRLDPTRRVEIAKDLILDPVKDTLHFQLLMGRSLDKTKDIDAVLRKVSWRGNLMGPRGFLDSLVFESKGMVTWRHGSIDENEEVATSSIIGRYQVKGNELLIWLDFPYESKAPIKGALSPDGYLFFPNPVGTFTDIPSECEI